MSLSQTWFFDRQKKWVRKSRGGDPVGSVAFYGPTDSVAGKFVVGVTADEGAEAGPLERWYAPDQDARRTPQVWKSVLQFIDANGVKAIVMPDRPLGCPHEEGTDYPKGKGARAARTGRTGTASPASSAATTRRDMPVDPTRYDRGALPARAGHL